MTQIGLSKAYNSREEAVMGGFKRILTNGNDWHYNEYAFWVILKTESGKPLYHYCAPQSNGSRHYVTIVKPNGLMLRGYCHTHPVSMNAPDFSSGDLQQFRALVKRNEPIPFFLMNGFQEIRFADNEKDFMRGKPICWIKGVTP